MNRNPGHDPITIDQHTGDIVPAKSPPMAKRETKKLRIVLVAGTAGDPKDGFPMQDIYDSCAAIIGSGCFESMMHSQIPFYKILECCILVAFDSGVAGPDYDRHEDTIRKAYRHVKVHLRR